MTLSKVELWERFQKTYFEFPSIGLSLDLSRMSFGDEFWSKLQPSLAKAFAEMKRLEGGEIANLDEKRMVGHYWLREPSLAPTPEIRKEIEQTQAEIEQFAGALHSGKITISNNTATDCLIIGIGGSALGPQFVTDALGGLRRDYLRMHFMDNTDPDGFDRVIADLGGRLASTLCVVISKSGGTKETRNGMLEAQNAFTKAGLPFPKHAVAITGRGSELDRVAERNGWLRRFPMWDWVGGRTSELSAVGLLPAALQGIDIRGMLEGAKACDALTRAADIRANPAALLAGMWFQSGQGKGLKDMVVIPYKDRLSLFSRYLQQLVMESLGKDLDRQGQSVHQGIAVYGNKGSTDQHAYIQQLRDGLNNFFVTFIRVLEERRGDPFYVEPGVTAGDYLDGFLFGTRTALFDKGRESLTLTIRNVSPFSVGVLIALYERAVGLYASLININAYHQPGVEGGKKAATQVLELEQRLQSWFKSHPKQTVTVEQLAAEVHSAEDPESVFHVLEHLAANPQRGVVKVQGGIPRSATYTSA